MFTIYSADVTGNPGNCSYPHKHVILDEDSLKAAICHDYVCAEYKNSYRNGDNFRSGDGILGDDVEDTIRHVGVLATEGMRETDRVILKIMTE